MKKLVIGSLAVVALSGIAMTAMGGMSWIDTLGLRGDKHLLQSRVNAYWQARVAGDLEHMAQYTHPLQESVAEPGMLVTEGYELHEIEVNGEEAIAKLTVHSRLKHPVLSARDRTIEMSTKWVKYEGKWYTALAPTNIYDAIRNFQGQWTPPTAKATPSAESSGEETSSVQ